MGAAGRRQAQRWRGQMTYALGLVLLVSACAGRSDEPPPTRSPVYSRPPLDVSCAPPWSAGPTIDLGGYVWGVAQVGGAVWTVSESAIRGWDSAGTLISELPPVPGALSGSTADGDDLWVADRSGALIRVRFPSAGSPEIVRVPVGGEPTTVAVGGGFVWTLDDAGTIIAVPREISGAQSAEGSASALRAPLATWGRSLVGTAGGSAFLDGTRVVRASVEQGSIVLHERGVDTLFGSAEAISPRFLAVADERVWVADRQTVRRSVDGQPAGDIRPGDVRGLAAVPGGILIAASGSGLLWWADDAESSVSWLDGPEGFRPSGVVAAGDGRVFAWEESAGVVPARNVEGRWVAGKPFGQAVAARSAGNAGSQTVGLADIVALTADGNVLYASAILSAGGSTVTRLELRGDTLIATAHTTVDGWATDLLVVDDALLVAADSAGVLVLDRVDLAPRPASSTGPVRSIANLGGDVLALMGTGGETAWWPALLQAEPVPADPLRAEFGGDTVGDLERGGAWFATRDRGVLSWQHPDGRRHDRFVSATPAANHGQGQTEARLAVIGARLWVPTPALGVQILPANPFERAKVTQVRFDPGAWDAVPMGDAVALAQSVAGVRRVVVNDGDSVELGSNCGVAGEALRLATLPDGQIAVSSGGRITVLRWDP